MFFLCVSTLTETQSSIKSRAYSNAGAVEKHPSPQDGESGIHHQKREEIDPLERYSELCVQHGPELSRHAMRLTGVGPHIEDLIQETFVTALQKIDVLTRIENPRAWLFQIVTNHSRNYGRKRQKTREREQGCDWIDDYGAHHSSEALGRAQLVQMTLMHLSEDVRSILTLVDIEGFKLKEVASMLDMNLNTVKTRVSRGRDEFRRVYDALAKREGGIHVETTS